MGIWSWAGHLLLDTPTFSIININIESKYSQVMTLLNWEQINIESKHLIHNHKIIAKSSIWVFLFSISWVIALVWPSLIIVMRSLSWVSLSRLIAKAGEPSNCGLHYTILAMVLYCNRRIVNIVWAHCWIPPWQYCQG